MKLLLDENLSYRLLTGLQPTFLQSTQVTSVGLSGADDRAVWAYAREHGFVLVSKDDDFLDLSAHLGPPPVVIRLVLGNCSNAQVLQALTTARERLEQLVAGGKTGVIELS